MELFAPKKSQDVSTTNNYGKSSSSVTKTIIPSSLLIDKNDNSGTQIVLSFKELGLCNWICNATAAMGYKRPTDIQSACIPAILNGRSVLGCAETGSGKTAAFALPILQQLSIDPYGIFAVILTPTRELAVQIYEQIAAFGSAIGVKQALIIGGVSMTEQSLALSNLPHIVISTPGRLRHHLESADPPNLSRARYLVLDEADRLLATGFSAELSIITESMSHRNRRTLLFSATLTNSLAEIESLASTETLRFDLTCQQKIPTSLLQQYIFVPAQVKICYLVAILRKVFEAVEEKNRNQEDDEDVTGMSGGSSKNAVVQEIYDEIMNNQKNNNGGNRMFKHSRKNHQQSSSSQNKRHKGDNSSSNNNINNNNNNGHISTSTSSVIVFVSSCRKCAEISTLLQKVGISCVALHSMLNQSKRSQALSEFKSRLSPVLVATDVAGRGLDIQTVQLVINFDIPKIASDYIHRVGRTARAGKSGRALSLVTPHDIDLIYAIETVLNIDRNNNNNINNTDKTNNDNNNHDTKLMKLVLSDEIDDERDIVPILNEVAKAKKEAQLLLMEQGFEEKLDVFKERKIMQRNKKKNVNNATTA